MDRDFINVLILGISFMFLFTSFQTGGFIQGPVIDSINYEYEKEHKVYGANTFIGSCLIYLMLSIANWIAPAIIKYLGPRWSMILSGITYILFISNFLWPQAWLFYVVSIIVGIGASIIWNAQGVYLTLCSNEKTMPRNSGIFWTLLQCSLLFGNIFVFTYFNNSDESSDTDSDISRIPTNTRTITYIVLSIVGSIGVLIFFFLGSKKSKSDSNPDSNDSKNTVDIMKSIKQSFALLTTKRMALLCATFWYSGIELSFFSGVYTTALGRINSLDPAGENAKKYAPLAGMLIGIGEIIAGLTFGILGAKTVRWGRDPIVIVGYVFHMLAFFLIFLNFPPDSTLVNVANESAYIEPSLTLALICSFLLGFADACFNTQIYSILGTLYASDSAPAYALFKFFQSLACAAAFFYSTIANLYVHLSILAIFASTGTLTFVMVEWNLRQDRQAAVEDGERDHQN